MKKVEYSVKDLDLSVVVWETDRQKDILDNLDEMLENAEVFGWAYIFENDSFYIEYNDGTSFSAGESYEEGVYKKRNIKRIIWNNANDTQVYGKYEVNEYGVVS